MRWWADEEWDQALAAWSPALRQAVLWSDGQDVTRLSAVSRAVERCQAWDVLWDVLPQSPPGVAAQIALELLHHRPDLTWENLDAKRPAQLGPIQWATAILFEAARQGDGPAMDLALAHGTSLREKDPTSLHRSVVSVLARLNRYGPAVPAHEVLFRRHAAAVPPQDWLNDDVLEVVAALPADLVFQTLGRRLPDGHVCAATNQAIRYNQGEMVRAWLPQVMEMAQTEKSRPSVHHPATDVLNGVVTLASASNVNTGLLRWVVDQARPWTAPSAAEKAFEAAAAGRRWEDLEVLWPAVRPDRVIVQAKARVAGQVTHDTSVVDWILARMDPDVRTPHLPDHRWSASGLEGLDEFPLTRDRMIAESRATAAQRHVPADVEVGSKPSHRPRP